MEAERIKKEKSAALEIIRAEAAESHRIAMEAAAAKKALEPVVVVTEKSDMRSDNRSESRFEGGSGEGNEEGEWQKQGPSNRVPISVAAKGTSGSEEPAVWKSRSSTSGGGGLENAFGGAGKRPTGSFGSNPPGGGGGGETSGWRGSRGDRKSVV